jgi:SAM-dependent methyltransferase
MEREEYRRMADMENAHWWYRGTRDLLADLLEPTLRRGGRFLDAGAGTGATGAWMAQHGDVVATDVEPIALDAYRERHETLGTAVADLSQLPFANDSFDLVLCVTVLYHVGIPDPAAAVRELARVARPGGVVAVMEPGVRRLFRAHDREVHGARRFSLGDLRRLMTGAGLRLERSTGAYSFLVPPAAAKAVIERGRSSSDLDTSPGGLGGVLGRVASLERALLRHVSLPAGLSVVAIGRKP